MSVLFFNHSSQLSLFFQIKCKLWRFLCTIFSFTLSVQPSLLCPNFKEHKRFSTTSRLWCWCPFPLGLAYLQWSFCNYFYSSHREKEPDHRWVRKSVTESYNRGQSCGFGGGSGLPGCLQPLPAATACLHPSALAAFWKSTQQELIAPHSSADRYNCHKKESGATVWKSFFKQLLISSEVVSCHCNNLQKRDVLALLTNPVPTFLPPHHCLRCLGSLPPLICGLLSGFIKSCRWERTPKAVLGFCGKVLVVGGYRKLLLWEAARSLPKLAKNSVS